MNSEQPARGVAKTGQWQDAEAYVIFCQCGSPEHQHTLWVEREEPGEVTVTIHTTEYTDFSSAPLKLRYDIDNDWLQSLDWAWKRSVNGLIRRVRQTWRLWRHGEIQYEADLILDRQTALNYADALRQAVERLGQPQEKV